MCIIKKLRLLCFNSKKHHQQQIEISDVVVNVLLSVQVFKDETGVKVNNTERHEGAHCPYNFPLKCAVCTCEKMIH